MKQTRLSEAMEWTRHWPQRHIQLSSLEVVDSFQREIFLRLAKISKTAESGTSQSRFQEGREMQ